MDHQSMGCSFPLNISELSNIFGLCENRVPHSISASSCSITLWLCQQFAIENGSLTVDVPIPNGEFPKLFEFTIHPIYLECNHPNWLSYFSEGLKPPTSNDWFSHFIFYQQLIFNPMWFSINSWCIIFQCCKYEKRHHILCNPLPHVVTLCEISPMRPPLR